MTVVLELIVYCIFQGQLLYHVPVVLSTTLSFGW